MLITVATRPNISSGPSQLPLQTEAGLVFSLSKLLNLDGPKGRKSINLLLTSDAL